MKLIFLYPNLITRGLRRSINGESVSPRKADGGRDLHHLMHDPRERSKVVVELRHSLPVFYLPVTVFAMGIGFRFAFGHNEMS